MIPKSWDVVKISEGYEFTTKPRGFNIKENAKSICKFKCSLQKYNYEIWIASATSSGEPIHIHKLTLRIKKTIIERNRKIFINRFFILIKFYKI
jgi:hypothetical protein